MEKPMIPPKQVGQPFDDHLIAMFEPVLDEAFKQHADVLRTVAIIFDYHGNLNTAAVAHAIWRAHAGPAETVPEINGTVSATLSFMELAMNRLFNMSVHICNTVLGQKKELDDVNRQLEEARQALQTTKEKLRPE